MSLAIFLLGPWGDKRLDLNPLALNLVGCFVLKSRKESGKIVGGLVFSLGYPGQKF